MSAITFRKATKDDLPVVVAMLADDDIGESREKTGASIPREYLDAFDAMSSVPGNFILLAESDGAIVGSLQLVFIPSLSRGGSKRAIIEAVRVVSSLRGKSIGTALMRRAIEEARAAGCSVVQLTSDRRRARAHLFYRRLGFEQSHIGFKLELA
ncbi:MAG: GNAT family N-acetyltransferase [Rhizomicrobium sp.]|jgi:GNAT superfamily N-acetyltransferase